MNTHSQLSDYTDTPLLKKWFNNLDSDLSKMDDDDAVLGALASRYITRLMDKQGWKYKKGGVVPKILQHETNRNSYALDWFDHHGKITDDEGKEYAIIEPYAPIEMSKIKDLIDLCEKRNLNFKILAGSPWYPLKTILILIYKR